MHALLSAESISDARAVIEVFRRDGPAAAQALVNHLLPRRLNFAGPSHATALALRDALAQAQRQPESVHTAQAFATALDVGRQSALQTWVEQGQRAERWPSAEDGQSAKHGLAADFQLRSRALDAALAQAKQAFSDGRFANNAFTMRGSHEAPSASDRHIFVAADGTLSRIATISAEGVHRLHALHALHALQALLGDDGDDRGNQGVTEATPEHTLTVRWLLQTLQTVHRP